MFKHYLKMAIRQILKNKIQYLLSIIGIAVGLLCFSITSYYIRRFNNQFIAWANSDRMANIYAKSAQYGYEDPYIPGEVVQELMGNPITGIGQIAYSYGARFDANRLFYQYDPVTQGRASVATPWVAYKNNRKDLFQTGYTLTNSVALTGKSDRGSVRASITHTKNEWILPNTGFQRITAMVSAQQQISRALRINFKSSYTYRKLNNTPALGYNSNSISYFLIFQNPAKASPPSPKPGIPLPHPIVPEQRSRPSPG